MAKSWSEKFENGKAPVVAPSIRRVSGFEPGTLMLIPIPSQVEGYLKSIPLGETRSIGQMSIDLAHEAGAEVTCPMCCGMFLRICSEKGFEELQSGRPVEEIAPFWRMAPPGAPIRKKLSFGTEFVDDRLALEHSIVS